MVNEADDPSDRDPVCDMEVPDLSKMSNVMRICGYEQFPGGMEAIRLAEKREQEKRDNRSEKA